MKNNRYMAQTGSKRLDRRASGQSQPREPVRIGTVGATSPTALQILDGGMRWSAVVYAGRGNMS